MALARIQVPSNAKANEIVTLRIAIQHVMETGFRYDNLGRAIPKNVVNTLTCRYNGVEVFRAELGSGIAANPYLEFHMRAVQSGELVFEWVDDAGERGAERAAITVTA
jgi:sulfur-oxidizing protein SoxZ